MGLKGEVLVRVSCLSVHIHINFAFRSNGTFCVQKHYALPTWHGSWPFHSKLYAGVDGIYVLMKQLNVRSLETRAGIIDVPSPPLRTDWGGVDCSHFHILHYQLSDDRAYRGSHGAAGNLVIVLLLKSEIAVGKHER